MDKKDMLYTAYEKSPKDKFLRLALAINSVKPEYITKLNPILHVEFSRRHFETAMIPVLECVFEWLENHPVELHYVAIPDDAFKDIDGYTESLSKLNDVSNAVRTTYPSYEDKHRELIYFQCRDGLSPADRCWMMLTEGGFCGCEDPNILYQTPEVWNFVTDDPAGMLAFISERTGNPIIRAKGSTPWSFENLVLVDDEPNDFYAAITASKERVFDKLPAPIYPDGDPQDIS